MPFVRKACCAWALRGVTPSREICAASPNPMRRANIAATLEPDADGDGFGDDTQDACPTSAATNNDCAPPAATITNGPKDKTQKKRATFEFTGADARAVASFQCSLDGGTFAPCTSPRTVKVKKGKHTFQVQAVDQAGKYGRAGYRHLEAEEEVTTRC